MSRQWRYERRPPRPSTPTAAGGEGPATAASSRQSALNHVDGQAATRGFLVFVLHVAAGIAHGGNHLVQRDTMLAVALERHAAGIDGLDRAHGGALDAGNLNQAAD